MYQSSGNEKEGCCLFFPSSTKREIWHFHVVVVQRRQEVYKKSMMRKVLFDQSKTIAFLPFSLRRRRLCLSSLLGSLRNDDGDGNRNGKKARGLDWQKKTTLQEHHAFLHISLPSLHDYNVKLPNFTFCRGREKKTTTFFFIS